jgi:hypothetical protein
MTSAPTRRKHLKSRSGCTQCKKRKIKSRHVCSFSPPPVVGSNFSTISRLDLELLHNYTTKTPLMKEIKDHSADDGTPPMESEIVYLRLRNVSKAIGEHCSDERIAQICQSSIETLCSIVDELKQSSDPCPCIRLALRVDPDYLIVLEEKRPEALLVFAYYCALLYMSSCRWWTKEWPPPIVESIRDTIDEGWAPWLQWPLQMIFTGEQAETSEGLQNLAHSL